MSKVPFNISGRTSNNELLDQGLRLDSSRVLPSSHKKQPPKIVDIDINIEQSCNNISLEFAEFKETTQLVIGEMKDYIENSLVLSVAGKTGNVSLDTFRIESEDGSDSLDYNGSKNSTLVLGKGFRTTYDNQNNKLVINFTKVVDTVEKADVGDYIFREN